MQNIYIVLWFFFAYIYGTVLVQLFSGVNKQIVENFNAQHEIFGSVILGAVLGVVLRGFRFSFKILKR